MILIGLTGHIAVGKSVVLDLFRKQKCATISCDEIYHYMIKNDDRLKKRLVRFFGKDILEFKRISLKKLSEKIVLSNNLHKLEEMTHPSILRYVNKEIEKYKKKKYKVCVVDIPLLFEKRLQKKFDYILSVYCSKKEQITRIKKRKISKHVLHRLFNRQLPSKKKVELSDYVLKNENISFAELGKEINRFLRILRKKDLSYT
ncbi:MAG: dephospho-CoA kinase [Endomicrobia bacterium]|nr:dephospho-CoA kinase [Endomicrobiia bacterium]